MVLEKKNYKNCQHNFPSSLLFPLSTITFVFSSWIIFCSSCVTLKPICKSMRVLMADMLELASWGGGDFLPRKVEVLNVHWRIEGSILYLPYFGNKWLSEIKYNPLQFSIAVFLCSWLFEFWLFNFKIIKSFTGPNFFPVSSPNTMKSNCCGLKVVNFFL